jgi:4-amino-4-deoxy-L-arabinose transferase-like glycosyltransferase
MSSKVELVTSELEPAADPSSSKQGFEMWFWRASGRRAAFWTIVVVLGFLQAWSHRLLVDHDGVAYLDVAENYARGAWSAAINGYYSPFYSWLLALALLLKFPRSWESTLLHLVNFVGYVGAFASFEFFVRELIRKEKSSLHPEEREAGLSESAWHTLGLGLFLYATLFMANISGSSGQGDGSTPDIFVLLFVFLAAGLLMRMQSGKAGFWTYAGFGVALAFGYLAKAAMLPISLVFLAVAGLISLKRTKVALAFILAAVCFALIAGTWIAALSHATGRYTFGDAGTLNFRWEVADRANPAEWGGQTEENEDLVHPPRRLWINPPVYEFATPIVGTFPLWYGSSYWLEGSKFHFSRVGQLRKLHEGYNNYRAMLDNQKEYLVLLFLLMIVQGAIIGYFKAFLRRWILWFPATAACGLYLLVRVEPRYVAPFLVMLWMSLFAAVKLPRNDLIQRLAGWAVLAAVLTTGVNLLHEGFADFHSILRNAPSEQFQVAEGLRSINVVEGQSLATIGIPHDSYYWARLSGVRVVSEIPTPNVNQYWFASPDTQEKVRSVFAQTGAVAIVTDAMPAAERFPQSGIPVSFPGWERIGSTSYFVFPLRTEAPLRRAAVEGKLLQDK